LAGLDETGVTVRSRVGGNERVETGDAARNSKVLCCLQLRRLQPVVSVGHAEPIAFALIGLLSFSALARFQDRYMILCFDV
jgi:hypothetical protein